MKHRPRYLPLDGAEADSVKPCNLTVLHSFETEQHVNVLGALTEPHPRHSVPL